MFIGVLSVMSIEGCKTALSDPSYTSAGRSSNLLVPSRVKVFGLHPRPLPLAMEIQLHTLMLSQIRDSFRTNK